MTLVLILIVLALLAFAGMQIVKLGRLSGPPSTTGAVVVSVGVASVVSRDVVVPAAEVLFGLGGSALCAPVAKATVL